MHQNNSNNNNNTSSLNVVVDTKGTDLEKEACHFIKEHLKAFLRKDSCYVKLKSIGGEKTRYVQQSISVFTLEECLSVKLITFVFHFTYERKRAFKSQS